jgi:DNA-binding NtrC family response regulator
MIFPVDVMSPHLAICFISNDQSMAAMLRLMFVAMGFKSPRCFHEFRSALPSICADVPDVILCDCRNDTDLARGVIARLRANHRTAAVPVVAITAANSEASWQEAIKAGASEFLFSPFNIGDLHGAVEMALFASQHAPPESMSRERTRA